jgi:uncharacterized repeat protein (TIGR01451 family)
MKTRQAPCVSKLFQLNNNNRAFSIPPVHLSASVGAILVFALLLLSSFHFTSSVSANKDVSARHAAPAAVGKTGLGDSHSTLPENNMLASLRTVSYRSPLAFPPPPAAVTVDTFASNCTINKNVFNLADADKTVCAKVTGAVAGWTIIWSNANFVAVQFTPITASMQNDSFTLSPTSSLGDWRVIVFDPFGGSVQAVTSFTVVDAGNPQADLGVSKNAVTSVATAGAQVIFAVQVNNYGPSTSTTVTLTDAVPDNTTFVSFNQLTGPVFTDASPVGGPTTFTIASMDKGAVATFVATYLVGAVSTGTQISNTATIASGTPDPNNLNNSLTAVVAVAAAPCVLTCPGNVNVNADPGQAGAVVSYSAPTSTGDCGQTVIGESGETIPPITCSPASGSFFPVGTTGVICAAQTGGACTFQVTVQNPGGLSISLTGANPFALECGTDFADPGATAVDATGHSVPVVISGTLDNHTPGSYTLTYTATQGSNSVSTTRTVNVSDTTPPAITIAGSNPYKIQQGTCLPFVDPGVSANDSCAGAVPVTSSIAGPSGLTSIDPNTAGTYTITYTASDNSTPQHTATATRTVLVGNFPPDEVDLGTANNPPVIKLLGGDSENHSITLECGSTFTDPGATATAGCASVPVTPSGTVAIHTPGNYTITYTATSGSFTTTATRIVTVVDTTPPTITVNGANPMTVECHGTFTDPGATAIDACAGNFAATGSGSVNANVVGQYTITYNATDPTGHAATPVTRTVNVVDTTPPVVTAPPNVSVNTGAGATSCTVTVSDATLGIASANDACDGPESVTRSGVPSGNAFPVGQTVITYSATDSHNNTGTATQTVTVIDNTPPTISCPANITVTLPLNSTATSMVVNYTAPVGTDNCPGATTTRTAGLASGASFPVGPTINTFRVTDASGNFAECPFTVTVLYNFTGFFPPVGNPPILNVVNAGRAIPVKFSLSGNKGLNIFAVGFPVSGVIVCDANAPPVDITQTVTAGNSSLSYDPGADQYIYVWKTDASWAGTCRQLIVTLNDGSIHVANFKFR